MSMETATYVTRLVVHAVIPTDLVPVIVVLLKMTFKLGWGSFECLQKLR